MEQLIASGLDSLPHGVVIHGSATEIVYCNQMAQELLGLSREQIEGKTSLDPQWRTVHEDYTPFDGSKHPSAITFKRQIPVRGVIMGVYRPDQDIIWLTIDSNPMFDEEGELSGVIVTFNEATDIKERQAQLSRLSQYLKAIMDTAPVILWACDSNGIFTYSRGSGLKALGLEANEVVGVNIFDLYDAYPSITEAVRSALSGERRSSVVQVAERMYDSHYMPIEDEKGEVIGVSGVSYDITELERNRMKVREQEELLMVQSRHAAMGEMLGMIAHQWRQPLTVISMIANNISADLMMNNLSEESLSEQAREIMEMTQYLSKTIDDFRNFFKPDKEKEAINVAAVMDEALTIIAKSFEHFNIDITVSNESRQEVCIYSHELLQVFLNLLSNAKEALVAFQEDQREVTIRSYDTAESVVVEVEDNGGGIDEAIMPKIFEPYFTTKGVKSGTGIGLYMSEMIIQKHMNGLIEVSNTEKGALFTIRLPLKEERHG